MMLYTNADMLTNKMKELQLLTEEYCLDVVMVTEIKLKYLMDPICVSSFSMGGYQVYTNLEGEEHRWVTAKNISNTIDPLVTEVKFDTSYNEGVWLKVTLRGNYQSLLGCIYRSPSNSLPNN